MLLRTFIDAARKSSSHVKKALSAIALLWLLPISFYVSGQGNNQPMQMIRARLINERTLQPVVFAHVINKNMRSEVESDSLGVFRIMAHVGDTLFIRTLSYYPISFPVSDSLVWQLRIPEIMLKEQIYELGSIDVLGWGSYQEFKYKVLHHNIPPEDNTITKMNEDIKREIRSLPKHPLQEQSAIPLGSPVTALYMLVSKEGKSIRRVQEARERDKVFLMTYPKFNREIVSQVTGLKDNLLDQFMMFCRPDDNFLLQANDYDIHERILKDYEQFKKEVINKAQSSGK